MKACAVSCIGCGKCEKECPFGAITVENNLAYIDHQKCRLCRKCVAVCPKKAIVAVNFPVSKASTTSKSSTTSSSSETSKTSERKEEQA